MRIFVFEFLTAHDLGSDPTDPRHAMFREGRAMCDAVVEDVLRIPGAAVEVLDPFESDDTENAVRQRAERCDYTIVIAPETGGVLERYGRAARTSTGRLLGPSDEAARLTADKLALATHWRDHGVPTPATTDRGPTACEAFPVVWKPRDGAGSTATYLLRDTLEATRAKARAAGEYAGPMILQEYIPGRAASVAFLCGPAGHVPLLPTFQHLSNDGRFHYLGGELPIPQRLADRAVQLAARAIERLPGLTGYVSVDLILGDRADGSHDVAIEVNPRLTTSYVGLRALAGFNLVEAMIRVANGEPVPDLRWKPGRVRFTLGGVISPANSTTP